jgi:hypothetical protein
MIAPKSSKGNNVLLLLNVVTVMKKVTDGHTIAIAFSSCYELTMTPPFICSTWPDI